MVTSDSPYVRYDLEVGVGYTGKVHVPKAGKIAHKKTGVSHEVLEGRNAGCSEQSNELEPADPGKPRTCHCELTALS